MTQIETGRARSIRVALPLCRSGLGLGTGVLTTEGELPVEFLSPGDRIVTYDRGALPLVRVIPRLAFAKSVLRVRPSVLDPDGNGRDILISARQKILVRDWRAKAMFNASAVLVEAARLVDGAHLTRLTGDTKVRLFQLVFEDGRHLVQIAGGHLSVASVKRPAPVKA